MLYQCVVTFLIQVMKSNHRRRLFYSEDKSERLAISFVFNDAYLYLSTLQSYRLQKTRLLIAGAVGFKKPLDKGGKKGSRIPYIE